MTSQHRKISLRRLAFRVVTGVGLGATLTVGAVALAIPGGFAPVALALGAGSLVALSGLAPPHKRRVTASHARQLS